MARRLSRDPLGLRRALSDRLLPGLVAAMALLAALALTGAGGAAALADRWQAGAAAAVTVQVPDPSPARLAASLALLRDDPAVAAATPVDAARVAELLRPWLGDAPGIALPGVIELRLRAAAPPLDDLAARLGEAVPGAELEAHGLWVARLAALARSVQGVAIAVLALVAAVAVAVVAVATRSGLAARRDALAVLHDLGATDRDIAGRFARRVGLLAGSGALLGAVLAVPALAALAGIAAPFTGADPDAATTGAALRDLPWAPLLALPPAAAAAIGWATAQATVRRWLRRLP
ncbi:FtsX-like permease family protein [Roseomonas sp. CCTCC AB2023176]|uniref:FtsX-like permease family protein n=1 Tax=Roseomonas sp. CCTCC AB2023176 TaxID=3342640 RepID=UPI0035E28A0D